MDSEGQGRDNNLLDSNALPLQHSGASGSGIRDSDPLAFLQLQVSPPPTANFYGEPATNYVGHASSDTLTSNVTQGNAVPCYPALRGTQSYALNRNLQLQAPRGIRSIFQLDNSRRPINIGGQRGTSIQGPDRWAISGVPQFDSSRIDGSFLSLGDRGRAGSSLESYASEWDYNVNRSSFFPFGQEFSFGPFTRIDDIANGSCSQNLGPMGNNGRLTLSHNDNGTLPGLTSGFDVSSALPSWGQRIGVNKFMPTANGSTPPDMENDMNSRYADPGSGVHLAVPSHLYTYYQYGSSEAGPSRMSRLPSEAATTRIRQQSIAEDNQGTDLTSNPATPFQSPTDFSTLGASSSDTQLRIRHELALRNYKPLSTAEGQAAAARFRNQLSGALKGGPSYALSAAPRKLIRQHTTNTPPAFTNTPHQQLHPSLPSPAQGSTVPALQQKIISNSANAYHPYARPSAMQSPLERPIPPYNALSHMSSSSSTRFPMAVPQTARGSSAISAKKPPAMPDASTRAKHSSLQRFIERQTHALAAYENKVPPGSPETTSSMPHIKWQQDVDLQGEESGINCLLCKRDLAYTPTGPVSLPINPPEVAVLFCGHMFHDHCLEGITPQDQRADPPCITCCIGETSA